MSRDVQVRICERLGVRLPRATRRLVHCRSEREALTLRAELQARLAECQLELHPTKTRSVYCKDWARARRYPIIHFEFLGYCFRPRLVKNSEGKLFCGFNPAVSPSAMRAMRATVRKLNIRSQTQRSLNDIAALLNPILRGWLEYYGRFIPSALYPVLRYVNQALVAWAMRKFRRFKRHKTRASLFFQRLVKDCPGLFAHWKVGMIGSFI